MGFCQNIFILLTPTYNNIIHGWLSSRTIGICRKKNLSDDRRSVENFKYLFWRMSKVYERIYTRGCERVRVHRVRKSRHASDGHERDCVYPPTIHHDFRQLAEVIVIGRNLSLRMFSGVAAAFSHVAILMQKWVSRSCRGLAISNRPWSTHFDESVCCLLRHVVR